MDRSKFHILEDGCQAFGVTLTEKQIEQFEKYYELLVEWNKVMNLTGITEFDEVMQKHFVDSSNSFRERWCRSLDLPIRWQLLRSNIRKKGRFSGSDARSLRLQDL